MDMSSCQVDCGSLLGQKKCSCVQASDTQVCQSLIVQQALRTEIGITIHSPSALESMRAKSCFRCCSVNIALMYKQ